MHMLYPFGRIRIEQTMFRECERTGLQSMKLESFSPPSYILHTRMSYALEVVLKGSNHSRLSFSNSDTNTILRTYKTSWVQDIMSNICKWWMSEISWESLISAERQYLSDKQFILRFTPKPYLYVHTCVVLITPMLNYRLDHYNTRKKNYNLLPKYIFLIIISIGKNTQKKN